MSTSIGPSGELIVATTTADPIATHGVRHLDPTLGGPGRLPGPAPYPLEIHTHGASRPVVRVEQVDLAAPTVQPVPGGGYLLVGARARWHGERAEPNAVVLDANGHHLRSFCIGDGVAHVQVSEAGAIWVGYTDEGVYGNSGGYRELADRLAVADLSGGARRAVRIVLPDGSPLPPAAELMARGSALHTVIGGVWLSLDLDEVT